MPRDTKDVLSSDELGLSVVRFSYSECDVAKSRSDTLYKDHIIV